MILPAKNDELISTRKFLSQLRYSSNLAELSESMLPDFFEGWPNPPSRETHLRILRGSYRAIVAIDEKSGMVVGFITAISDGVLVAFIPLLEVLPRYRGRGIGTELVRRMISSLREFYAIDLLCDGNLQPFYERTGMVKASGMFKRNYDRQCGLKG